MSGIHNIGAIVAHGTNEVLNVAISKDTSSRDPHLFELTRLKYKILLSALKNYHRSPEVYRSQSSHKNVISNALSNFLEHLSTSILSAVSRIPDLQAEFNLNSYCSQLKHSFPVAKKPSACHNDM